MLELFLENKKILSSQMECKNFKAQNCSESRSNFIIPWCRDMDRKKPSELSIHIIAELMNFGVV